MKLDPILLEILGNKVAAAAEEIGLTLQRTGRTLYVKETADFGTGLVDRRGRFFAYPRAIGVSHFIDLDVGPTIRAVGAVKPGDIIVTNHAYLSEGLATHSPDLQMLRPIFHGGELVCWAWCYIHATDMGGKVPSSISPTSHEIYQEGFLVPPIKLVREGVLDETFVALFRANCRIPDENMGDLKAMMAALDTGARRIADMIDQHGLDTVLQAQDDLIDYAAAKARDVLRRIPDGSYEFWDYLDDDMVSPLPVRIRLALTARDGEIELDFTGTDPQVNAAYNIATMGKRHALLTVRLLSFICTLDKTAPLNAGLVQSIRVKTQPGSLVHAEFPAAVGVRHASARRVADVVLGTLGKAAPGLVPAASAGANAPTVLAELDPETGRRNVLVIQNVVGGMGAREGHDGVDGRDSGLSNLSNNPLEIVEGEGGLIVREFAVRPDSGGAGRWRGGVGLQLTVEIVRDGGVVLSRGMERLRFQPWGVQGGGPAAPFRAILNRGRPGETELGKIDELRVRAGDLVTIMTPGGGGYGDPLLRDPEAVLRDVRRGFVTADAAREAFGCVIADGSVDAAATASLRAGMAARRPNLALGGPERAAWEDVFGDEVMGALNAALFRLPRSARSIRRRQFFDQVLPELRGVGKPALTDLLADRDAMRAQVRTALAGLFGSEAAE